MRYRVLAADYDGTIAREGRVLASTIDALERFRRSGRRLLLVTGRQLDDLAQVFDRFDLFDRIVAENGAVLCQPATEERIDLAERPPEAFIDELRARGVEGLAVGDVIVATWRPHETEVIETIAAQGLDLQVIFNKGAVMVLPSGVNKATGLGVALDQLGISDRNVIGVGDAENDHAFLERCELSVAVANALPAVKDRCDHVTGSDHGAGVEELIAAVVDDESALRPRRRAIEIGTSAAGEVARIEPYGEVLLVAGPSGSGKSTLVTAVLERLQAGGYQVCVVDPEGDYADLSSLVSLGDAEQPPSSDELMRLLATGASVSLNLIGVALERRPEATGRLLAPIVEQQARTGRPHWLIVDEAHHLFPADWQGSLGSARAAAGALMLITVHPDWVAPRILEGVTVVAAVGDGPDRTLSNVAGVVGAGAPSVDAPPGTVVTWRPRADDPPMPIEPIQATIEHQRHIRKYAAGDLEDRAFMFTGPDGALSLRAQNLTIFCQMAEGVDEATWRFHLERGDLARWFAEGVKDDELAEIAAAAADEPETSREVVLGAIRERYTAPASA